ncbi:MAG: hypothetical protein JNK27_06445 [Chitinophagaceae bacterium]|nr:hypothetical protein [Chitinophagaceae bacterium]
MRRMLENEFEKQVRQKMNGLNFQPATEVWEEVERRIQKKKRRRIIILWFLLAGLFLGGGWWLSDQLAENKSVTNKEQQKIIEKTTDKAEVTQPVVNDNTAVAGNDKKVLDKIVQEQVSDNNELVDGAVIKAGGGSKKKAVQQRQTELTTPKMSIQQQAIDNSTAMTDKSQIQFGDKVSKQPIAAIPDQAVNKQVTATKIPEPVIDSSNSSQISKDQKSIVASAADTTTTVQDKNDAPVNNKDKKGKWEIGFSGGLGTARLTNGQISGIGNKSLAENFSSTAGSSPQVMASRADSIPLTGTAWQLGVYAKRKLGKKVDISTGLNFSTYTVKQRVGVFVDSVRTINNDLNSVTSGGFYRAGSLKNYPNRYYYLQVPLLLHWQVNRGEKLPPLVWENGLAVSFLVGSNAVVYDRDSYIFFKDKKVYNTVNLVYQSAFMARLFKEKKHPLSIGISYQYHISRLQKINPPDFNYLSSFGIKLSWVLKK